MHFSSRTGGHVLSAGLGFHLAELITVNTPDLDLGAHFCSSPMYRASSFRFMLAHLPHFPFSLARLSAKNSLSPFKAASLSWLPSEAEKLRTICISSVFHLEYLSGSRILTSFLFIVSCFYCLFCLYHPSSSGSHHPPTIANRFSLHSHLHGECSGLMPLKPCRVARPGVSTCVTFYQTNSLHIQNLLPPIPLPPMGSYLILRNKNPLLSPY